MDTIIIRNCVTKKVIFGAEESTMKLVVLEAVRKGISLSNANLRRADLRGLDIRWADLRGADLRCAELICANLSNADLSGADLRCAELICANLHGADLSNADFSGADLRCANLSCADLSCANLHDADLSNADFSGADLRSVNLSEAKNIPFIPLVCPDKGSFIGWKKVNENALVKLEIPEDARRSSATSNKCRCDKAKVLAITDLDGNNPIQSVVNPNYTYTLYKVGEMVYPDSFDENRWNECSHGIHFFMSKQEAIDY